jgi:steroid Delta-isomerase
VTQTDALTPAMAASLASWRCVQAHDREGWLALMADDTNIAANRLRVTCEETFPSSSPAEIAHILVLRSEFAGGFTSAVRGVFCYRVNDDGLITNMRGYWNLEGMQFGQRD